MSTPIKEFPKTAAELAKLTPEQIKELQETHRARFATVAHRGSIPNRLSVDLPPHIYGEWVHNDPASIKAKQDLGFFIDTEYAPKNGLHGDVNTAIVGDVIHMIAPQFVREQVLVEQDKRRQMIHGKPGAERTDTADDRQFQDAPLKTINESKTSAADANRIAQALSQK